MYVYLRGRPSASSWIRAADPSQQPQECLAPQVSSLKEINDRQAEAGQRTGCCSESTHSQSSGWSTAPSSTRPRRLQGGESAGLHAQGCPGPGPPWVPGARPQPMQAFLFQLCHIHRFACMRSPDCGIKFLIK